MGRCGQRPARWRARLLIWGLVLSIATARTCAAEPGTTKSISRQWAEAVGRLRYSDLPPTVRQKLSLSLADALGVIVYTRRLPEVRRFRAAQANQAADAATELVGGTRVSLAAAAAINAFAIHGAEMDDSNLRNQLRASCVAVPAPLAWADATRASGPELLVALAISFHLSDRLATLLNHQPEGELHRRGWMPSSVCGAPGAAAAVARLARLDPEEIASAIGLAAGDAGGTFQYYAEGSDEKRIHVARSQALAIDSVRLAARGFRAAEASLEGAAGLLNAVGYRGDLKPLGEPLEPWDAVLHVKPKFFAASQGAIPWLETLEAIRRSEPFEPQQVRELVLAVDSPADSLYTRKINEFQPPRSLIDAQLSVNFSLALLVARGSAFVDDYDRARLDDPELLELARRVRAEISPSEAGRLQVVLADGRRLEGRYRREQLDEPYPPNVLDYRAKFDRLAAHLPGKRRGRLWEHMLSIEAARDVAQWLEEWLELVGPAEDEVGEAGAESVTEPTGK